jgi:hypothetical protein
MEKAKKVVQMKLMVQVMSKVLKVINRKTLFFLEHMYI